MEFEKIFASIGVVLIAILAYTAIIGSWSIAYNNNNVGSTFASTYNDAAALSNSTLFSLGIQVGNNTNSQSGAGSTSSSTDIYSRALSIITAVPTLLGLVPALFNDAAVIFGIPATYIGVAAWIFMFTFAILMAYLLIIGVRRLP